MSVLVAGGCGFIGANLVRELVAQGEDVVAFDLRPNAAPFKHIAGKVKVVQGDSTNITDILHVIQENNVHDVFHLIGLLADVSQVKPSLAEAVSVGSTLNFLEAARLCGLGRIVYASSSAVYHPKEASPVKESAATCPPSVYGATKVMSEFYGMHYHRTFGLDFVALRFTTVYGLGKFGGSTGIISQMIEKTAFGDPITVEVADAATDWIYIKDAVKGLLLARRAANPQQRIYNIGGASYTVRQVADVVQRMIPDARIELEAKRTFPWPPAYDISMAKAELNYEPSYDIQRGVADFIEECRKVKRL